MFLNHESFKQYHSFYLPDSLHLRTTPTNKMFSSDEWRAILYAAMELKVNLGLSCSDDVWKRVLEKAEASSSLC